MPDTLTTIKRNTKPTIPITIKLPFEKVKGLEFMFKREIDDNAKVLVHKVYEAENIIREPSDSTDSFTVLLSLTAEETLALPPGETYLDTRVILIGDIIPATTIVALNVAETLFGEAYNK